MWIRLLVEVFALRPGGDSFGHPAMSRKSGEVGARW